jgi:hypothetical protein
MASELKVDKFTGVTTAGSIDVVGEGNSTTTNLQQGLAKAWVHFTSINPTTTRDSFNISSLTDTGTGDTTVNVTNAFSNDDYACVMFTNAQSGTGAGAFTNHYTGGLFSRTTSSIDHTAHNGSAPTDSALNDVVFHGDLA